MKKLNLKSRWNASSVLRYLVVGTWNTLFSASLIYLLLFLSNNKYYEYDVALAFILSTGQSFFTQRKVVWKSSKAPHSEFLRFFVGVIAQYLLTSILLFLGVHKLDLKPTTIALPILITVTTGFYFFNRKIVFKTHKIDEQR